MSRLREFIEFSIEIRKKHPTEQMWSGWWDAPSTLQPLHEHHGKTACLVQISTRKCRVYIKGVDEVYEGDFEIYVKHIA